MYQARPFIQDVMGGQQLNDQYFCQQLLPDYMEEHGVDWDITYDERGHFTEPHTERSIGLGTHRRATTSRALARRRSRSQVSPQED